LYVGILNMDRSRSGSSCICSYLTKITINNKTPPNKPRLNGERKRSNVDPRPSAYKIKPNPKVISTKPMKSNYKRGFISVGCKNLYKNISHNIAKGILKKNKNGQVKNSIIIPPTVGPIAGATIAATP